MTCSTDQCSPQPSAFAGMQNLMLHSAAWYINKEECESRSCVCLLKLVLSLSDSVQLPLMISVFMGMCKSVTWQDTWRECWGGRRDVVVHSFATTALHFLITALMSSSQLFAGNLWFLQSATWAALHILHQLRGKQERLLVCSTTQVKSEEAVFFEISTSELRENYKAWIQAN